VTKLLVVRFILSIATALSVDRAAAASSGIQRVKLNLCGNTKQSCLTITASEGDTSSLQNTMSLTSPIVNGLELDKKIFSSAIVDLANGLIYLRERQQGVYIGEWTINLDSLKVSFYAVPK
jgi:hypothetical protein